MNDRSRRRDEGGSNDGAPVWLKLLAVTSLLLAGWLCWSVLRQEHPHTASVADAAGHREPPPPPKPDLRTALPPPQPAP